MKIVETKNEKQFNLDIWSICRNTALGPTVYGGPSRRQSEP